MILDVINLQIFQFLGTMIWLHYESAWKEVWKSEKSAAQIV